MMHIEHKTFTAAEQAAQARARRERLGMATRPTNEYYRIMAEKQRRAEQEAIRIEAKRRAQSEYMKAEFARIAAEREAQKREAMIAKMLREREGAEAEARLKTEMNERLPKVITVEPVEEDVDLEEMATALTPRKKVSEIILEVMAKHGFPFPPIEIIGKHRFKYIIAIRQECMYEVFKQRPDLSLPQIGRKFRRDHSTVMHGIAQHKKRIGE